MFLARSALAPLVGIRIDLIKSTTFPRKYMIYPACGFIVADEQDCLRNQSQTLLAIKTEINTMVVQN